MFRNKTNILITVIIAILIVIIGFYFVQQKDRNYLNVLDAVPETSALVFESNTTGFVWEKLSKNTSFWPVLSKIDHFKDVNQQLLWLDSLFTNKQEFKDLMRLRPMALALHETNQGFAFLFIASVQGNLPAYEIKETLYKIYGERITIVERNVSNNKFYIVIDSKTSKSYTFAVENGLLIGSFNKELVELAVEQTKNQEKLVSNPDFVKVKETCGSNAEGYLYINYNAFAQIIATYSTENQNERLYEFFGNFGDFAALDVMIKQNSIMLNGYSNASSTNQYLAHLQGKKALKNTHINILPYSAKVMLHFGITDFTNYWLTTSNNETIDSFNKKWGINIQNEFIEPINGELTLCISNGADDAFVVLGVEDMSKMQAFLNKLASKAGIAKQSKIDNINIKELKINRFIPSVFGDVFSDVNNFVYAVVDNYLLVANHISTLEHVIRYYRTGRTFDLNENFKSFQNNLSESANVTLYVNLRENLNLLNTFVSKSLLYELNRNQDVVKEFEAFSIQFAADRDMLYTTIYIKHNPNYKEESLIAWKVNLDAPVFGKPHIVEDHVTKKYNVVAFDAENKMYLINPDGEILWKKQLPQTPLGDVFVVDYFKNGKYQFLFNSESYLILIDRNGDYVKGYPVKLRSNATNGISVFDYNNKKDYRILVSCADKLTYNYELNGREVDGWNRPKSLDIVSKPVERLVASDKDYIIITDINGDVRIVDRRGQTRIQPRGIIEKSRYADFYVNKTNSKGTLLTTDKAGKLLYVSGTGLLSTSDMGNYSENHFFLYEDFNQDGVVDFIYLDGNKLRILDRFRKELFAFNFKQDIITKPVFFNITRSKRLLGIVSESSREIYLIDKSGKMIISSGLSGETPFDVGSLHNNNEINLLTGIENTLINYLIF